MDFTERTTTTSGGSGPTTTQTTSGSGSQPSSSSETSGPSTDESSGVGSFAPYGMVILGGAKTGMSFASADAQNRALPWQMDSVQRAYVTQRAQVGQQTAQASQQRARAGSVAQGRIRVALGSTGASAQAVERQNALDTSADLQTINSNYGANLRAMRTQYNAQIRSLDNQMQNPLMAAFSDAAQVGMQILPLLL